LVCSWGIQGGLDIRAEVFGEQGTLLLDQSKSINGITAYKTDKAQSTEDTNRPHMASDVGWSYPYVDEWNTKGHRYELRHFIDCILEKEVCRSPVERGLRTLKIVHSIYASIETGQQVAIEKD
jgi:predicted dehydrogenase